MKKESKAPQSEERVMDIIEILTFLNYDGTITLHNIDPIEAFS